MLTFSTSSRTNSAVWTSESIKWVRRWSILLSQSTKSTIMWRSWRFSYNRKTYMERACWCTFLSSKFTSSCRSTTSIRLLPACGKVRLTQEEASSIWRQATIFSARTRRGIRRTESERPGFTKLTTLVRLSLTNAPLRFGSNRSAYDTGLKWSSSSC